MPIPDKFIQGINDARLAGGELLEAQAEPIAVAQLVEEHRWFWKPQKRVRLVLLAESHVRTSEGDLQRTIQQHTYAQFFAGHPQPPAQYVRLIYNLGYGEPEILHPGPVIPAGGTPGFWKIFARIAGMLPLPVATNPLQRVHRREWKVAVLQNLQRRGVWLLDGSVHAVYLGNGERLPDHVTRHLHQHWWTEYGNPLMEDLNPENIWVIGKSTFDRLTHGNAPIIPPHLIKGWIYQPRARGRHIDPEANWMHLMADVPPDPAA